MSHKPPKKPTDEVIGSMTEEEKEQEQLAKEHAQGAAFAFHSFEYDPDVSLGTIDGDLPVSILYCQEEKKGICMSFASAQNLAEDILEMLAERTQSKIAKA